LAFWEVDILEIDIAIGSWQSETYYAKTKHNKNKHWYKRMGWSPGSRLQASI